MALRLLSVAKPLWVTPCSPNRNSMDQELYLLAERLGQRLQALGTTLAAAESCTGGWLAKTLTDVPGSSQWFDRGFVTYSNRSKQEMLGVLAETLDTQGAVSEGTVREMAEGALRNSAANFSLAISGVAGPGGGTPDKPVGSVWFAWGCRGRETAAQQRCFSGERETVRRQAVRFALLRLLELADAEV